MESLEETKRARDVFLVRQYLGQSYGTSRIMRQLKPENLSFFELIILANTVHDYAPLYSLFRRQCFWFSNTIYDVIEKSYKCEIAQDEAYESGELDSDIRIPPDVYLPSLAGRWKGILVTKVSEKVVLDVREKFVVDFKKSTTQIKQKWDRLNSRTAEVANLRARITELEDQLRLLSP